MRWPMTSAVIDMSDEVSCPLRSALKNLAKLHDLPPFERMFLSGRIALVAAESEHVEQWRTALALPPLGDDGRSEGFWMGDRILLVTV
jgi:hypothetical protein